MRSIYTNENLPNNIIYVPKYVQNLARYYIEALKLPKISTILPKWQNFAKSSHAGGFRCLVLPLKIQKILEYFPELTRPLYFIQTPRTTLAKLQNNEGATLYRKQCDQIWQNSATLSQR